ncbi:TPA: hypothetical protein ACY3IM_004010, partial [Enterobacter kobei]
YKQICHNKNKTFKYHNVINTEPLQYNHKKPLTTELSQNHPASIHHIYPATYQVYITVYPIHRDKDP